MGYTVKSTRKAGTTRAGLINDLLRHVFGMAALRPGQRQVIDSVLAGRNTLAIMPTGGGKSLCYQIPASLLPGTTVVVSPLISLMQDQLDKLDQLGIDAAQVNSSLPRAEELEALDSIRRRASEIVFCTPERLATPEFQEVLRAARVSLLVVDEAHCISQWGHDFRPAFLEIGAAVAALGHPPVLALTATATEDVIADIGTQLGLNDLQVINTGMYRPNLYYRVLQSTNAEEKLAQALALARDSEGAVIVYAATVKAAKELHDLLEAQGESVALYHGRLPAAQRKLHQQWFMSGERRVMVATNAFGMGIDKPDVRQVIHLQVPASLEAYYQESGRAGRDGEPADCTLLYFQDDKRVQQFFLAGAHGDKLERDRAALELMVGYAQSGYCRWKLLLDYFGANEDAMENCGCCDNCITPPGVAFEEDDPGMALPAPPLPPPLPHISVGNEVRVPKYDVGTVLAVAGDQVTIAFPGDEPRTFLADYVQPV